MNIFYIDENPQKAAEYHADKHASGKMIVESAQMLSTAHRILDNSTDSRLYKATHVNHPSTKWTRESKDHYFWLYELFIELCREYTYRYHKVHLSETKLKTILQTPPKNIIQKGFVAPPLAIPDEFKTSCHVQSYRNYYVNDKIKKGIAKWEKNRNEPHWVKNFI